MEEDSFKFKRKNIAIIVFEVLVIALGVGGITFATSRLINSRTQTKLTIGEYNVDYVGDNEILASELEPISDDMINIDTKDNVLRLEFSLRGVSTNNKDDLIYDIMLNEMNIDCSLLNKYTKWNLYKNGKLLSNGNFSPSFDGNILGDNYRLTSIQQDLPNYDEEYDKYVLIVWISESCDDIETCELVDQSGILNSNIEMKVFIALYEGAKKEYERIPSNDVSCANKPELYDNMIPIKYSNGNYVVASLDSEWYNYSNQEWANAIVTKNNKYKAGDIVRQDDVLGYYVWIPRFKYKTFNVLDDITDSYNAYDNGIDIIFESGLSNNNLNLANDVYITHPVFSGGSRGFWISKYEISYDESYKFIPDVEAYTSDSLDNYKDIMETLSVDYELGNDVDTHIITNLEWGALLYLSHSKYGVCNHDGCAKIGMNDSYISGSNKQDTTTRNVYGVYDINGSASEYVVGESGIGSASNEVKMTSGNGWYDSYITNSERGYYLRGGIGNNLFYQGDVSMSETKYSSRSVLMKTKEANQH